MREREKEGGWVKKRKERSDLFRFPKLSFSVTSDMFWHLYEIKYNIY